MKHILSILLLTLMSLTAQAQMYGIRNGEKCIVHDVSKGNTLYGVGQMYAVSVEEILESNPWASDGLSIGETLFIPVRYVNKKESKNSPDLRGNVLEHTVRKGETMYSLSKRYNIAIEDLQAANSDLDQGLKKGMTIRIPTEEVRAEAISVAPAKKDSLMSHLVASGETLFSISQMYEVKIEDIMKVNGGMPEGLKKGQKIRVPRLIEGYVSQGAEMTVAADSAVIEMVDGRPAIGFQPTPLSTVNVGLMLPFSINSASNDGADKEKGVYQMTDISFEFYRGVAMALEDLSREGLSSEVFVFDVDKQKGSATMATQRPEFDGLDIILGPLHRTSFKEVARVADAKGIPTISPLTASQTVINGNRTASKVATSDERQADYMAKYLYTRFPGEKVFLLKNTLEKDASIYTAFERSWKEMVSPGDSTELVTYDMGAYEVNAFVSLLDTTGRIILAVPSAQRPFVSDVMTKFTSSRYVDKELAMYGLEDWMKYENVDAATKNQFDLRLCASKYIDYDRQEVKDFMKRYNARYNTVPSAQGYSLIAYDITRFYLKGLQLFGPEFVSNLDLFREEGLDTGFDFERIKGGGWENRYCFMLRYEDYDLLREN